MAVVLAASIAAACSGASSDQDPEDERRAAEASPTHGPHEASEQPSQDEAASEPLVLATRADRPRLRLSTESAQALLTGAHPRLRVVHAASVDQVTGHTVADHAAVLRRVRRSHRLVGVLPASALDLTVRPAVVGGVHPLRMPDAYPLRTPGEQSRPVTRLMVVGDVMLTRGVPDPATALAPMARRLARADITVGTLESTFSDEGRPQQGGDSFAASPAVVGLLENAGFDALSLANNHVGTSAALW